MTDRLASSDPLWLAETTRLFIDGAWIEPQTGEMDDIVYPASEAVVGRMVAGSDAELERALAAARRAFDEGPWPDADRDARADLLARFADRIEARRDEILRLIQIESGYTLREATFQFVMGLAHTRKFIELARRDPLRSLPILISPQPDGTNRLGGAVTTRLPIGVVAAITPYNAGFLMGVVKVVPAIAAGNAVVLKPSPYTPLQSVLIAEELAALDLPPGVFNLVTGGIGISERLTSDPRVDMVSFTGSDLVGTKVMAQAAPTLKKVHLELGGKSPLIVRHDAELDRAVGAAMNIFFQCGQGCSITTRVLVDNRLRPAFVAAFAHAAANLTIGDPLDPAVLVGPLIRDAARRRTEDFVGRAIEEGATLVQGGRRPQGLDRGFFFEPTIFDGVSNHSHLGQNEVFGPIAAVIGFDDDEEAVRIANASQFGLGGAIVSRDAGTAMKMALRMRTGQVSINGGAGGFHTDIPFGGFKRSGIGREWGEEGFNEYTELKAVMFPAG
jgi:acyl-CoA reductase-like NAD-dependent aldehyde dehydrogenase